ncbi:MAG TPA: SAM hydroxide adenosyltransferase, partial [Candidatus Caenarcaniphilales bacterium]
GSIQAIDHFGNLITNVPAAAVAGQSWSIKSGKVTIPSARAYSDIRPGELVGLVGSHGWIEVAVNGGNAQAYLHWTRGECVQVVFHPSHHTKSS